MVQILNLFTSRENYLNDSSREFINSLPSIYTHQFRKRRALLHVWSSHKYCVMIKSHYLIYYRLPTRSTAQLTNPKDQNDEFYPEYPEISKQSMNSLNNNPTTLQGSNENGKLHWKYINLRHCQIKIHDEDGTNNNGFVFYIMPDMYQQHKSTSSIPKGSLVFAADTEKERLGFLNQVTMVQSPLPSFQSFETMKLLGKGHYGRVILARNTMDNKLYAMKEMKLNQVKSKIIYGERSIMEWIGEHPFIIGLDYAYLCGKSVFLISKFMPGGDLFLHMQNQGGCFSEDIVKFYGAELILALEHLHKMNILHRDIKPENILLDAGGHLKLADMGLAKALNGKNGRTYTMCGTDTYLPPEMVGRYSSGHGLAVDLWQLGSFLFEMSCGYPPFYIPQSSQRATHQRILFQSIRYPNNISKTLKHLLVGLLDKRQENRLGYVNGLAEVKSHEFFRDVNWDQVLRKEVSPPIKPASPGENLVNNFDEQFTKLSHEIHIVEDQNGQYERDFIGFDYVRRTTSPQNTLHLSATINRSLDEDEIMQLSTDYNTHNRSTSSLQIEEKMMEHDNMGISNKKSMHIYSPEVEVEAVRLKYNDLI